MRIIALAGPAGAGKDTVADRLCAAHKFRRYEFARPIKDMLKVIGVNPTTREEKGAPHPMFGKSPRQMMQTLGSEWGRECVSPDIWLRLAADFAGSCEGDGIKNLVIADCRFQNEAAWVAEQGGAIWHIDRPNVAPVEAHESENGLEKLPGDLVLQNWGSIYELHKTVDEAAQFPRGFTVQF